MKSKKQVAEVPESKPITHVIGLDLSLTGTGWSRYEIETEKLTSGTINSKLKGMPRLHEIRTSLDKEIPEGSIVYIENYGFGSKGQVVYQGELGGIIRYTLWSRNIKYVLVPPTVAKKFLVGKGVCEKSLIIKELYKRHNIDVDNDNQADAIVLGLIGRAVLGKLEITKAQEETIKKVIKDEK